MHTPVLVNETLEYLDPKPGDVIVDCTVGAGGHSGKILEKIAPHGRLIGIEQDIDILKIAEKNLESFKGGFVLKHANFQELDLVLEELKIDKANGLFFDLGVSSWQLENAQRGFSFNLDGPLDMRMDRLGAGATASFFVNSLSKDELADIIFRFGQERYSRRIADAIIRRRKAAGPIRSTYELGEIICAAVGRRAGYSRIHPATRTFQALRIAVNAELDNLQTALKKAPAILAPGGVVCVISFHSLEDRIVKNIFKELNKRGVLEILTKKPISPKQEELCANPRSRSAKLRAGRRL